MIRNISKDMDHQSDPCKQSIFSTILMKIRGFKDNCISYNTIVKNCMSICLFSSIPMTYSICNKNSPKSSS